MQKIISKYSFVTALEIIHMKMFKFECITLCLQNVKKIDTQFRSL